jgi:hypothetical protein
MYSRFSTVPQFSLIFARSFHTQTTPLPKALIICIGSITPPLKKAWHAELTRSGMTSEKACSFVRRAAEDTADMRAFHASLSNHDTLKHLGLSSEDIIFGHATDTQLLSQTIKRRHMSPAPLVIIGTGLGGAAAASLAEIHHPAFLGLIDPIDVPTQHLDPYDMSQFVNTLYCEDKPTAEHIACWHTARMQGLPSFLFENHWIPDNGQLPVTRARQSILKKLTALLVCGKLTYLEEKYDTPSPSFGL